MSKRSIVGNIQSESFGTVKCVIICRDHIYLLELTFVCGDTLYVKPSDFQIIRSELIDGTFKLPSYDNKSEFCDEFREITTHCQQELYMVS